MITPAPMPTATGALPICTMTLKTRTVTCAGKPMRIDPHDELLCVVKGPGRVDCFVVNSPHNKRNPPGFIRVTVYGAP